MKKIVIVLLLVVLGMSTTQSLSASEGPIEIQSIEDLYRVRYGSDLDYIMVNDLDFADVTSYDDPTSIVFGDINSDGIIEDIFTEMNTEAGWSPIPIFSGYFDGNGHVIKNLYIHGRNYAALFNQLKGALTYGFKTNVEEYAVVTGVGLESADIYGIAYAAGIAITTNAAMISESYVDGDISVASYWAAGIVANHSSMSIVENCYVTGSISSIGSTSAVAGIAGVVFYEAKVANNYVTATLKGHVDVGGIISQVVYGTNIITANNISFSDYIYGEYSVYRSVTSGVSKDFSLFSRYDTRISVMSSIGSQLQEYYPGSIDPEAETHDSQIFSLSGHFEGFWMTYEDFVDESFYTSQVDLDLIDFMGNPLKGGFTDRCAYIDVLSCSELTENEQTFYQLEYWDFDNTWEILDGADRPTLQVFNHDGEVKDAGTLSTAPIAGDNVQVNGTTFTGGDTINISWDQAYLVVKKDRDGLLYDIYYSEGLTFDREQWTKVNEYDLTLNVVDGRTSYNYQVNYTLDSSNLRFYIVSHNGEEESDAIYSGVVVIDNGYPEILAETESTFVTTTDQIINEAFKLVVNDATRTIISYTYNGVEMTDKVTSTKVFSEEGEYEFTVVDEYGYSTRFTIAIDRTIPLFQVVASETELSSGYTSIDPFVVHVASDNELTLTYIYNDEEPKTWTNGEQFDVDGEYVFTATDAYGNTSNFTVLLDRLLVDVAYEITPSSTIFTFSEKVAKYSLDGTVWMTINDSTLTLEETNLTVLYIQELSGAIGEFQISHIAEPTNNNILIWTISIATPVIGFGVFAFIKFGIRKVA